MTPETAAAVFWKEIQNWQGVPYRYGGSSDSGVDCSGLAVCLYENLYGIELPRTTDEQVNSGFSFSRNALQAGDLVFFRFRGSTGHVGIYLQDRRFTHASKTQGVTISRLDDPFWKSRYQTARRIVKTPPIRTTFPPADRRLSDLISY